MAAPKMREDEAIFTSPLGMHFVIYFCSFLLIYIGWNEDTGIDYLGAILFFFGFVILSTGIGALLTKIIADGVSWGIYANRSNIVLKNSNDSMSNHQGGDPPKEYSSENSGFVSRAKDQLGTAKLSDKTATIELPPGMKKCKECATVNDSTMNLRCYICQGELI